MNQSRKIREMGRGVALLLALGLLLAGCASKQDRELFEKVQERSPELQVVQQSEKAVFHPGEDNETIVLATYLPKAEEPGESFIVAVHPAEHLAKEKPFLLAGKAPESSETISRKEIDQSIRRTIPPWFELYRLRFPKISGKRFLLEIRNDKGEVKKLTFYRGPKYLITKPKPLFNFQ
jgi:hypothetical protein